MNHGKGRPVKHPNTTHTESHSFWQVDTFLLISLRPICNSFW